MSVIFAQDDEDGTEALILALRDRFERATGAFNEMIQKLEAGDLSDAKDAKRIAAALENAGDLVLKVRLKLDEQERKRKGIAYEYAIDFNAARSEIGRRLACLCDA